MKVADLLEILEDANPEAEIRFAAQPSWPMEYTVRDAIVYNEQDGQDINPESADFIYLVEGRQLGYLPGDIKAEAGW